MLNSSSSSSEQRTTPVLPHLAQQLAALDTTQLAWISGYSWALSQQGQQATKHGNGALDPTTLSLNGTPMGIDIALGNALAAAPAANATEPRRILILSCSQTGNASSVAKALYEQLQVLGTAAEINLTAAADYRSRSLPDEDIVLLVTSTQGEGEAPEEAVPLYKFLHHKKSPDLSRISFAVLGLGDSSYPQFNQAAKDFDQRFAQLGAKRLIDRIDCDLDFKVSAHQWRQSVHNELSKLINETEQSGAPLNDVEHLTGSATDSPTATYDKQHPYSAELLTKQRITTENASEVMHYEIDLADSGITYQAGDSLGVYFLNSDALVEELLNLSQLSAEEPVTSHAGQSISIAEALKAHLNITESTPQFIRDYAALLSAAGDNSLDELAKSEASTLIKYIEHRPPVFIMKAHPMALNSAQQLHDLFRPLTPRLYSISSAQEEVGDEVHLTVKTLRYENNGTHYQGAASGHLADALEEGDELKIFIEPNAHFRLPQDPQVPIIMIGAGTGIAPFRSFLQARQANGDSGANWLIFGNQRFTEDFLYQSEWIQLHQAGILNKYDFAWSRQGKEKQYVQHKLAQRATEVWQWLQNGAHIYVCGDAKRMAKDVEDALIQIISQEAQLSIEDAEDFLNELREEKRYQRDVY